MTSSPPPARRQRSKKNLIRRLPTEVLNEIFKLCNQPSKISLSSTCTMLRSVGIDEVFRTRRLTWGYDRKYRTLGAAIGGLLDYVHLSKQTTRLQHLEIKANFDYTNDNDLEDEDGEDVDHIYLVLQKQLVASSVSRIIPLLPSLRTVTSFFRHPSIFKAVVEHPVIRHYFAREDEDVVRSDFDALRNSQYLPDRDVDSPLLLGDAYMSEYEDYDNTPIDEVLDLAADSHIHFSNLHIDLHRMEEDRSLLVAAIARPIITDLLLQIPSLNESFVNETLIPFAQARFTSSPSSTLRLQIDCFDGSTTADSDLLALVPGLERIGLVQHWPQPSPSTGPDGSKVGLKLEVRFNPSVGVVGVRFNKIGKGGKVDPSFLQSLSSVYPRLESLLFLPGERMCLFEDWNACLDAFGTFPYLQHLHVPWDVTLTPTFYNPLACSRQKWDLLAQARPSLHRAAVAQFGNKYDTSFLRLGVSLNLRMVRRLASVLPLGCKVVWGGYHWKGIVVEGGGGGGKSMRGEWLRGVPNERIGDCFVCKELIGEDLLAAARRCPPEDLDAELALGLKGDRTIGGDLNWDLFRPACY